MLTLVKRFRSANPTVHSAGLDVAVKRIFLQGISQSLKRGILVFCNDLHAAGVTRDQLLKDCRRAKVYLTPSAHSYIPVVVDKY